MIFCLRSNVATINPPCTRRSQEIEEDGLRRMLEGKALSSAIAMTKVLTDFADRKENQDSKSKVLTNFADQKENQDSK